MKSMNFKVWLEAIVSPLNLGDAMKKTLEFNVQGKWEKVDSKRHPWYKNDKVFEGYKFTGRLRNAKAWDPDFFFLSAHAILEEPIENYDSIKGKDGLRIIASMFYFDGKGGYQKLGERSNVAGEGPLVAAKEKTPSFRSDGSSLKTPLELANWVNYIVSNFRKDGGDDDDEQPEPRSPEPSNSRLVSV